MADEATFVGTDQPVEQGETLFQPEGQVAPEEFESKGRTTVATHIGYAFNSTDPDVPIITESGVTMTKAQAEAVLAESDEHDGHVYLVSTDEGEES